MRLLRRRDLEVSFQNHKTQFLQQSVFSLVLVKNEKPVGIYGVKKLCGNVAEYEALKRGAKSE